MTETYSTVDFYRANFDRDASRVQSLFKVNFGRGCVLPLARPLSPQYEQCSRTTLVLLETVFYCALVEACRMAGGREEGRGWSTRDASTRMVRMCICFTACGLWDLLL